MLAHLLTTTKAANVRPSLIRAGWAEAHDFANLTSTDPGLAGRLNGNYFLIQDMTVFNDTSKHTLTGSAGSDWPFAGTGTRDRITDLIDSDRAFVFGPRALFP